MQNNNITDDQMNYIFNEVKKRAGIFLTADKKYLLDSRLLPIARENGYNSVAVLIDKVKETRNENLMSQILDAMTTNESSFFRDIKPFDILVQNIIPNILKQNPGKKKIRIWSAACSTGQESYSIAMKIKESVEFKDIQFEIIASDISDNVLVKARKGLYSQFEIQRGVPVTLLLKYFNQIDKSWQINESIKTMINFRKLNLLSDFLLLGKFDIIFCRNVLIYFDIQTKIEVLLNLTKSLEPYGVLFLGSTESIIGLETNLKLMDINWSGIYVKKNQ